MHTNQPYVPYMFDTYTIVKNLMAAKFSEEQAEVLVKTISETRKDNIAIEKKIEEFDKDRESLATKHDVDLKFDKTKNELATKSDIEALKSDVEALRGDVEALKSDIEDLKKETKTDIEGLKKETKDDIDFLKKGINNLEIKMLELKVDMLKWMFGMIVTQLGFIILILKFFFKGIGGTM